VCWGSKGQQEFLVSISLPLTKKNIILLKKIVGVTKNYKIFAVGEKWFFTSIYTLHTYTGFFGRSRLPKYSLLAFVPSP
jgi:hypothetical protein